MVILGLTIGEFCSAALVIDGVLVGASYEERFHRKKCLSGFPYKAIDFLLKTNQVSTDKISEVAIVNEKLSGLEFALIQRLHSFSVDDFLREAHDFYYPTLYLNKKLKYLDVFKDKIQENVFPNNITNEIIKFGETPNNTQKIRSELVYHYFGNRNIKISFVEHHLSHALYGYLFSPNKSKNNIIFTADSMGDNSNSNVYITENLIIKNIFKSDKQNLGRLFRNITLLLGMKPYQHEFKVMGLAPYSSDNYNIKVKEVLDDFMNGFKNNDWNFNRIPKDHYFEFKKLFEGIRFDNIAGGLQRYFEENLEKWFLSFLKNKSKHDTVIFSGGLSMNVKANLKLSNLCEKNQIEFFSAPSGDDYSHAISAAFSTYLDKNKLLSNVVNPGILKNLNLGYEFSINDKEKVSDWSKKNGWKVEKYSNKRVAELLHKGKIFGLCHGKAEFGARALGFRSIIANPSEFDTIRKINTAIKMRDFWMPFAPSVISGHENKFFIIKNNLAHRFMETAVDTTKLGKEKIKAAIHPYDGTARPQIVDKETNPIFYSIISEFGKISGVPVLLNTSLNLHGYPIVNDCNDLIFLLENSKLDGCVLDDRIILR